MSISAMADNKVVVERRKERGVALNAEAERGTDDQGKAVPKGVQANVLNQLMLFIPTEVITVWVAFLAVHNDPKAPAGKKICHADFSDLWIAAAGFAVAAAVLTLGLTWRKSKEANTAFKLPVFEMVVASGAFMAWAIALPETPMASACWYDENAGAFIVLVTTVLITTTGYIFGKTVRFEKA